MRPFSLLRKIDALADRLMEAGQPLTCGSGMAPMLLCAVLLALAAWGLSWALS